ncbi:MAG TPA: response regulator, partial [Candidatus Wallbacteria bacterium]|nr:response regulator [Candidatus Wallbacteria bacterium]
MTQVQKTILLVEDEFVIARVTAKVIQSFGFNVIIANTGEEALDIFKKSNAIDLILMDIDLGDGIDGTEVAAIILKDIDIPIVFLSSHTESEIVEKTEKITSYGYVVKGSGNTVLNASIKMAFRLFEAKLKKKEKDEALKKSEQVKSELIEKLNEAQQIEMIGSWDWDIKTGSVWWSDETYRIFGVTAQELTPSFSANARFIHPDDIQRYEQLFNHSLQS